MNINASIIDQRLVNLQHEIRDQAASELGIQDENRLKPLAFVYLCTKTLLDLDSESAFECLTEGGGDFGVDAMHASEEIDGEFVVTLIQAKYKANLDGNANFPEKGVLALINAIRYLFDPSSELGHINARLQAKVEEIRSLIRDGYIPRIRAICCSNGEKWSASAQTAIDRAHFGEQVTWEYVNHDVLINLFQRHKSVNATLSLLGKAIIEDMNFSRVCIGRMRVTDVASLMQTYGDRLLERNIRRYLGLHGNRVNEGIRETLYSGNPEDFYFFNNGLTLVCSDFSYNALQADNYLVRVENLQIINGGQTCMTIYRTLDEMQRRNSVLPTESSVLIRIYKLPRDNEETVLKITQATNSQNPVDLKDLRSNDSRQQRIEYSLQELGYTYRRQRSAANIKPTDMSSGTVAEAVLAIWRGAPHQAKFLIREHFGKLYERIFTETLNGAQVVVAVLIYRIAENRRRCPMTDDPFFVRYASCFIAMQMGRRLLNDLKVGLDGLDHRNFSAAKQLISTQGDAYFSAAVGDVDVALNTLYGNQPISIQQLSATFRRGDLIERLLRIKMS